MDACQAVLQAVSLYDIFGVKRDATLEEIRKSYKKLSLLIHPDKNQSPFATQAFVRVGEAFAILKSPVDREQYDRTLQAEAAATTAASRPAGAARTAESKSSVVAARLAGSRADNADEAALREQLLHWKRQWQAELDAERALQKQQEAESFRTSAQLAHHSVGGLYLGSGAGRASASQAESKSSKPPSLSETSRALLVAGDRFRVKQPPGAKASSAGALPGAKIYISLWLSSDLDRLQWRLMTSPGARPDGIIAVSDVRAVVRSVSSTPAIGAAGAGGDSGCWLSIKHGAAAALTVEASRSEVREQWLNALSELIGKPMASAPAVGAAALKQPLATSTAASGLGSLTSVRPAAVVSGPGLGSRSSATASASGGGALRATGRASLGTRALGTGPASGSRRAVGTGGSKGAGAGAGSSARFSVR